MMRAYASFNESEGEETQDQETTLQIDLKSIYSTKKQECECLCRTADPADHLQYEQELSCVKRGSYKGQGLAVLTSGGDSSGMNAAIRAVVRMGLFLGCKVYLIREGYQGLVDGGEENIQMAKWSSVSGIITKGGTVIGSARCSAFKERKGRLKAAKNLVKIGVSNLVVIGGDGSLTGAAIFQSEWSDLLKDLLQENIITEDQMQQCKNLNIAGLVGSIDNDFCGTDMTIGTDSALHRIVDAVDCIISTAWSHKRTFIMEVMGRHCGYLALVGALCTEADYLFIPERPAPPNWESELCRRVTQDRAIGHRLNIILVAEGAIDTLGNSITCEQVRRVIVERTGQDTRVTVLGHIQRGGNPSAFDRLLGCRMGVEAVMALMEEVVLNDCASNTDAPRGPEPYVVTLVGNEVVRVPLMQCVQKTLECNEAMKAKDWDLVMHLRGGSFKRNYDTYCMLTQLKPPTMSVTKWHILAVMHVGAPSCGMNACVRGFVRSALYRGDTQVVGIQDGFDGLLADKIKPLQWIDVRGWMCAGGAFLGTKRTVPSKDMLPNIAKILKSHRIQGILIVGGFEAFKSGLVLQENEDTARIPILIIPATISNNVPGTEFSIGCDTALNVIVSSCDRIRQAAAGIKKRVIVVETMGGHCGYLATLAGLAGGAEAAYIFEEKHGIRDLSEDLDFMSIKMANDLVTHGLVLRNENSSENYNTDFISRLYAEEGKDLFSVRMDVLGHLQQGGTPSPFDRKFATKLAAQAVQWLAQRIIEGTDALNPSSVLLGLVRQKYKFTPLEELKDEADFMYHIAKKPQWWVKLRPLLRILARYNVPINLRRMTMTPFFN